MCVCDQQEDEKALMIEEARKSAPRGYDGAWEDDSLQTSNRGHLEDEEDFM
jgi:hypothetical protein